MLYIITILTDKGGCVQVHSSVPPVTVGTMYIVFEGGGSCCLFDGHTTSPNEFKVVRPTDSNYVSLDATAPEKTYFVTLPESASMISYKREKDGLRVVGLKTSTGAYRWDGEESDYSIDELVKSLIAA